MVPLSRRRICAIAAAASSIVSSFGAAGAASAAPLSSAASREGGLPRGSPILPSTIPTSVVAPPNNVAFQGHLVTRSSPAPRSRQKVVNRGAALFAGGADDDDDRTKKTSFLSTSKSNVSFKSNAKTGGGGGSSSPSNLSDVDGLLLSLTSDRTSLLLGSAGMLLLLLNRLISFPEDADLEASRSRIDLLGVFAAGSVLLNGITKLDVESAVAESVALDGVDEGGLIWNEEYNKMAGLNADDDKFRSTVGWALSSFLRCSPARTAVLLTNDASSQSDRRWTPLASAGVLPSDPRLRTSIPDGVVANTPILDRMLREDGDIKGGTVGGAMGGAAAARGGPRESYLPTLQALPGRAEFTYLPPNAQEALILPATKLGGDESNKDGKRYYAVVLGGDTAKSFAPRDVAWCREVASWIGDAT